MVRIFSFTDYIERLPEYIAFMFKITMDNHV